MSPTFKNNVNDAIRIGFGSDFGIWMQDRVVSEQITHMGSTRRITIVFGGDLMQHIPQITAAKQDTTYNYAECFQYLKELFDSTDCLPT